MLREFSHHRRRWAAFEILRTPNHARSHVDLIETGRIICSFKVPPRLLNGGNYLHGGVIATLVDLVSSAAVYTVGATLSGISVEINVSFLDAAYADILFLVVKPLLECFLVVEHVFKIYLDAKFVFFFCFYYLIEFDCLLKNLVSVHYQLIQEEIEIEARALRIRKVVAVLSVEFRKKIQGKLLLKAVILIISVYQVKCRFHFNLSNHPHKSSIRNQ